jgi:hypothetical protein
MDDDVASMIRQSLVQGSAGGGGGGAVARQVRSGTENVCCHACRRGGAAGACSGRDGAAEAGAYTRPHLLNLSRCCH